MKRICGIFVFIFLFMLTLLCGFVGKADASLIYSLSNPTGIISFNEFTGEISVPTQVSSSVGENIMWSSNYNYAILGNGSYYLGNNGGWNSNRHGYVGLNEAAGTMRFDFNSGLINAVGGFVNYTPGYGIPTISVLDNTNNILETYTLNISTPNAINQGEFWGISRSSADIKAFALSNAFVVLDDLTYYREQSLNAIPEPASLSLLGLGLLGLIGMGKKRKA